MNVDVFISNLPKFLEKACASTIMEKYASHKISPEPTTSYEPLLEDGVSLRRRAVDSRASNIWHIVLMLLIGLYCLISAPMLVVLKRSQVPQPYCKFLGGMLVFRILMLTRL